MNFPIEEIRKVVGFGNELTLKFQFGQDANEPLKVLVQPSVKIDGAGGSKERQDVDAALSSPLFIEGTEGQIADGFLQALQGYRTVRESLGGLRTNLQQIEEAEKQARAAVASKGSKASKDTKAAVAPPQATDVPKAGGSCVDDLEDNGDGIDDEDQAGPAVRQAAIHPLKATPAGNPNTLF
jgi:PRTRC genetic system protein E